MESCFPAKFPIQTGDSCVHGFSAKVLPVEMKLFQGPRDQATASKDVRGYELGFQSGRRLLSPRRSGHRQKASNGKNESHRRIRPGRSRQADRTLLPQWNDASAAASTANRVGYSSAFGCEAHKVEV